MEFGSISRSMCIPRVKGIPQAAFRITLNNLAQASDERAEHHRAAFVFDVVVLIKIAIEMLVMAYFIALDHSDQTLEHRFIGEGVDRSVIGCRAHLNYATGGHF